MSLPITQTPNWYLWEENEDGEYTKAVSTFVPEVLSVVEIHTSAGIESHVRLKLHFQGGQSNVFTIPLSTIENVDWFRHDKRCLINPSYSKARQYIANVIRIGMENAKAEKIRRLDHLGVHNIDGDIGFIAGDRVITRSPATNLPPGFELAQLPFRLDIDPELTPREAFDGMRRLISLSNEIGRVLVAHTISGIIRAAFKKSGFNPCAVLVIIGSTGMLKSHYVPHLTQLYNRNDGIGEASRFNSTLRFIEDILYEYCECTAVIDDLCTAESRAIKRINETTSEEIIRRIGDDSGRGRKEGSASVQKQFRGNVVFICEYTFGKESTVPRALAVNLTKPPDGGILDQYQRHQPLLVSTFYYFFIRWYVENFHDIRNEIDARLTKFRNKSTISDIHGRLRDTHFYLQTAYMIFLNFCKDSGFMSAEDVQDEYHFFGNQLVQLVLEQQARIRPDQDKSEGVNYLKLIRKLYKKGNFRLADSTDEFNSDKHDGLIYYDCLCLRRDKIEKRIRKVFEGVKLDAVINELLEKGALKLVGNKKTVQISCLDGARFYAIWLDKLD